MPPMMKKVILTGGTRGIGKAILDALLADRQYFIHSVSQNQSLINANEAEYAELLGTRLQFHSVDLRDSAGITEFADQFPADSVYGLVNNAGICRTARLDQYDQNVWRDVMDVNLNGLFHLTSCLIKKFRAPGRIVNISSQLGVEGRAGYSAYCASKFAIIGLTKCWAKELGTREITANAICPGWVDTEMSRLDMQRLADEKAVNISSLYEEVCRPLELKRFTAPREVANLVQFLMSEGASGITGRDWLLNTVWNQE